MAKKRNKKSSSNEIVATNDFTTLEVADNLAPSTENEIRDDEIGDLLDEVDNSSSTTVKEKANEFLPRLTAEMKEKLERIEAIEKHCVELEETNAKLTDSINAYIEELTALKAKKSNEIKVDGELSLDDLKENLKAVQIELGRTRKSLSELRDENDSYLMKISELTFENAKLTCQIQEIEKNMSMVASPSHSSIKKPIIQSSTGTMKNQPQFANPYLQNGYQDW